MTARLALHERPHGNREWTTRCESTACQLATFR
jgi:hypothetical protein